jgi:hypothetical protein
LFYEGQNCPKQNCLAKNSRTASSSPSFLPSSFSHVLISLPPFFFVDTHTHSAPVRERERERERGGRLREIEMQREREEDDEAKEEFRPWVVVR